MNCPSDGTTLLMSERHGIEIDYCPECRGIWLDRGELDKILERAQAEAEAFAAPAPAAPQHQAPQPPASPQPSGYGDRGHDDRDYDRRDRGYDRGRGGYSDPRYRKKKSPFEFLGDIFD